MASEDRVIELIKQATAHHNEQLVPQFSAEITVVLTIVGVIIVPHHNDPITMRRHNKTSNLPHQNNGDHGHNEGDRNIAIVA